MWGVVLIVSWDWRLKSLGESVEALTLSRGIGLPVSVARLWSPAGPLMNGCGIW